MDMKKISLLVLIALSFQAFATSPLKTIGKVLINPIMSTSFDEKHHHHKKKHRHHKPKLVPVTPQNPATNVSVVAPEVKPEVVITAAPVDVVKNVMVDLPEVVEVDVHGLDIFYGQMDANATVGSDDLVDTLSCRACDVPQELGYKARATQWIKNSWEQLPSSQQLKVSCSNAFDELQFNAYKHRVAIAATVTVALAACGGYYWYKNYYKAKTDKN